MTHIAVFLLALAGFATLLLAMARHQQDWLERKLAPPVSRKLRGAGFALLALAFLAAGAGLGWAYGAVCWLGWLSATAALVTTLHTNRESLLRRIRP